MVIILVLLILFEVTKLVKNQGFKFIFLDAIC